MTTSTTTREEEFSAFVATHGGSLRHVAHLLTGSRDGADDLLQDALLRTWLHWRRVEPQTAWAYTRRIMVNLATDRWRRKRYETVSADLGDWQPDAHAAAAFSATEDRDFIVDQLSHLSARERAIVVLRYYADLSEAEVAEHVGVSVGTVKSTCSRALSRLRSRNDAAEATRSKS
ncbi:SigE family RNA polymerase sigma factor [Propioniciclava soli]|uniref:SigE family RNA polymerase sigma factor n=1 Tax=Propioniciclava soli TaxID=2775081 RepID=A0ABZ3C834_9ACTN|nr:SigE family RNA polymerase sigma factor [Propioniciclava soli]